MRYVSTRGGGNAQPFSAIVLEGLAADGGLMVPAHFPVITQDTLSAWQKLSYVDLAHAIMQLYIDDILAKDLYDILQRAYTKEKFGHENIVEVKALNPQRYILGLSNGPTLAFKDMAMQFLGELFPYILEKTNRQLNIVGATSGDTGSSAEYAMKGKPRINVFMLSPQGRMSPFQAAQMYSVQDKNIINIAVKGVFDDCQDLVKTLNSDAEFKAKYHLGAVNSINWARILAQVVYYFKGYLQIAGSLEETIDFVVPSGNFGNIYAGFVARSMGLPIGKLILATNENNVLDEFFTTGQYRVRQTHEVHETSSPSMDIAKASNFERFIYNQLGSAETRELWQKVESQGGFDLSHAPIWQQRSAWQIDSGASSHRSRVTIIQQVYHDHGVMIDPHTADGMVVGERFLRTGVKQVVLETALPAKFAATIQEALQIDPPRPKRFMGIEQLPQRVSFIENDVEALKALMTAHLS